MTEGEARIRAHFARQTLMATFGAKMTRIAPGDVEITAPISPGALQHSGYGHAALTFALGDTAAGFAAATLMEADQNVLTAEMKINLLRPAQGRSLIARGRVEKPGRRLFVVSARVAALDEAGTEAEIAILMGTMLPV